MAILQDGIDTYLQDLIPQRDAIMKEMEDYAERNDFPIVGPQVGQILVQYTKLVDAKRIFECGSGYGYSAMWFARASVDDAHIYCTDGSKSNADKAATYFKEAGVDDKITFLVGDAVEQLEGVEGQFDIIYNDVDKVGYPEVYKAAIPRLRQGGLLITDNSLWSGKVLDDKPDKATQGVVEYNNLAFNDDRVLSMILPIRDGVCVSYKL